jgi:hypothetical protein
MSRYRPCSSRCRNGSLAGDSVRLWHNLDILAGVWVKPTVNLEPSSLSDYPRDYPRDYPSGGAG